MANGLQIENLSKALEISGDPLGGATGNVSEARVMREMQSNGMSMPTGPTGDGSTFSGALRESLDKVNTMQVQADTAIKEMVAGRSKNLHETMLTVERADTSLKLMMQVRNKILDAYREIMRMQV